MEDTTRNSADQKYLVVVIGGSAGSIPVVTKILSALPEYYPLSVILCLHRRKEINVGLEEPLKKATRLHIREPDDKDRIRAGTVYLAPANYHLLVESSRTFALSIEKEVNYSRPSIDITFETAAHIYGKKMIGIILSGANQDGARGLRAAKIRQGYTIVQDPEEAAVRTMPEKAMELIQPDAVLTTQGIIEFLLKQSGLMKEERIKSKR